MYEVHETLAYRKSVEKNCSFAQQQSLERYKDRLARNPFIGRPLSVRFFRELKMGSKRAYFVIHTDAVYLLFVGNKKAQRSDIERLRRQLGF
jgi:hypothetical protein